MITYPRRTLKRKFSLASIIACGCACNIVADQGCASPRECNGVRMYQA
jgi:hypothetical protein